MKIQILVIHGIGERKYISMDDEQSIWDLKEEISTYFDIPSFEQKLIFKDCSFDDDMITDIKLQEIQNDQRFIAVHLLRQLVPIGKNVKPALRKENNGT